MPHFDAHGNDTWICQKCGTIGSGRPFKRPEVARGNVCKQCADPLQRDTDSLRAHCRQESGGLSGPALDSYINRYYRLG